MKPNGNWTLLFMLAIGAGVVPNAYHHGEAGAGESHAAPAPNAAAGAPASRRRAAAGPRVAGADNKQPEPAGASSADAISATTKLRELLEGFIQAAPDAARSIDDLARDYREAHRGRIFSLVATVPDPESSSFDAYFDEALDAIQRAAGSQDFLPDRFFLPWNGRDRDTPPASPASPPPSSPPAPRDADGGLPLAERLPGILLFRRVPSVPAKAPPKDASAAPDFSSADLLVVFVVGELAKRGLHHQAFAAAADLAWQLREPSEHKLFVLAPQFSGTAFSLRLALDAFAKRHSPREPPEMTVISGAATDPRNYDIINFPSRPESGAASATFEAMNVPFDQLQAMVLQAIAYHLRESPESSSKHIAMLIETGTQWASSLYDFHDPDSKTSTPLRLFHFPLHISQLRAKREKSRQEGGGDGGGDKIPTLRNTLELRLDRTGESDDDLPAGSSLTPYMIEIMLHEQLAEIAREHFQFLGIAATDPTDLIFIVQEARKYCPGVQMFTLSSHALFGHPDLLRDLDGLIVASTYSLASLARGRETFANQGAEGIYNAFVGLMDRMHAPGLTQPLRFRDWRNRFAPDVPGPWMWLTMVSNGAIWPFHAERPPATQPLHVPHLAAKSSSSNMRELVGDFPSGVYVLVILFALGNAAYFLRGYHRRWSSPGLGEGSEGLRYVVVISGCLIATCLYWASVAYRVEPGPRPPTTTVAFWAGLGAAGAVALMLGAGFATWLAAPTTLLAVGGKRIDGDGTAGWWLAAAVLATLALGACARPFVSALAWPQPAGDVDIRLALARTVQLTSGVSPAVPLLYLASGLYLWGISGLRRVRDRARLLPATTPFPPAGGIWTHTLTELASPIWSGRPEQGLMHHQELVALGIASVPCLFFCHELLPTFESPGFDPLFKALFLSLAVVVIAGAGRVVAWWRQLQRLLRRIAGHPMVDAYHRAGAAASPWLQLELRADIPPPAELAVSIKVADLAFGKEQATATPQATLRGRLEQELTTLESIRLAQQRGEEGEQGDAGTHAALFRFSGLLLTALERLWQDGRGVHLAREAEPARLVDLAGDERIIATAEVIVARQVITLFRFALGRLRGLMTFVSAGALLLVCAIESYPFHPVRFVSLFVWSIAIGGTGAILFVILSAERDAVLSRTAKSRPGRIDLNAALVSKVVMYGLIPAGLLAASAFPQVGDLLFSWLSPILRAFH